MKLLRLCAVAAAVSLAACTSSPTDSVRGNATNPSFDGGGGLGSGNYVGGENDPGTNNVAGDTTTTGGRGGNMLGSGN